MIEFPFRPVIPIPPSDEPETTIYFPARAGVLISITLDRTPRDEYEDDEPYEPYVAMYSDRNDETKQPWVYGGSDLFLVASQLQQKVREEEADWLAYMNKAAEEYDTTTF